MESLIFNTPNVSGLFLTLFPEMKVKVGTGQMQDENQKLIPNIPFLSVPSHDIKQSHHFVSNFQVFESNKYTRTFWQAIIKIRHFSTDYLRSGDREVSTYMYVYHRYQCKVILEGSTFIMPSPSNN